MPSEVLRRHQDPKTVIDLSLKLRQFTENDLLETAKIETVSFTDAWPNTFFTYNHGKAPELFLVAEDSEGLRGYVVGELREKMFSGRRYMSKMGHILNIAVNPRRRRRGVGTKLMAEIEARFQEAEVTQVTLEVRESNFGAQGFYSSLGFSKIRRVKAYYPNEDAIVMCKTFSRAIG